jgi:hypothetical protein
MSEIPDPFRILQVRRTPLRQDGTEPRNSYVVDVEVEGIVHNVYFRRSSGAHIPHSLKGHPNALAIKAAVTRAILDPLLARIEAHRKAGRLGPSR